MLIGYHISTLFWFIEANPTNERIPTLDAPNEGSSGQARHLHQEEIPALYNYGEQCDQKKIAKCL